jgi:hypothetical protein
MRLAEYANQLKYVIESPMSKSLVGIMLCNIIITN